MYNYDNNSASGLQDLFPGQSPEWYGEADANLDAYLELVVRIYERISADPEALARLRADLKMSERGDVHGVLNG